MRIFFQFIFCDSVTDYISRNHFFVMFGMFFKIFFQNKFGNCRALRVTSEDKMTTIVIIFEIKIQRSDNIFIIKGGQKYISPAGFDLSDLL